MPDDQPLRLRPPTRTSDAALGERLAELARASTPTTVRLRPHRWAAPVAGVALLVASGGVAWGTHAVAHHERQPVIVPGVRLAPAPPPGPEEVADAPDSAAPSTSGRSTRPTSPAGVAGHLDHAGGEASGGDRHPSGGTGTGTGDGSGTPAGSGDRQHTSAPTGDGSRGDGGGTSSGGTSSGGDSSGTSSGAASSSDGGPSPAPSPSSSPGGSASCMESGSSCD